MLQFCEITTSSALEPLVLEVTAEQPENALPHREAYLYVLQLIFLYIER